MLIIKKLAILLTSVIILWACAGSPAPVQADANIESTTVSTVTAPAPASGAGLSGTEILMDAAQIGEAEELFDDSVLPEVQPEHLIHREIWGYVVKNDEAAYRSTMPITDIGYFAAELDSRGNLLPVPPRSKFKNDKVRVHLVLAEVGNHALTHFVLNPDLPYRNKLLLDLVKASQSYEGLQLDFETVLKDDGPHYLSFLAELKKRIGKKTLSVALPARVAKTKEYFDYSEMAAVVDRILIMAYDEHWSGSKPGSVASLAWCRRVAAYVRKIIPKEKLVLGLPFYGRAWADKNLSKAYRYTTVSKIMDEKKIVPNERRDEVPYFEYSENVTVRVYYEDAWSTLARASLYGGMGIDKIGFWRIGQEDPKVWAHLKLKN